MTQRSKQRDLKSARALEQQGKVDSAVRIYMHHGEHMEASRALAESGRFKEAGELLLMVLNTPVAELEYLDSKEKKGVYLAATYLYKAGESRRAAQLLVAIGRRRRAAEILERSGDMVGAERILRGGQTGKSSELRESHMTAASGGRLSEESAQRLEKEGKLDLAAKAYMRLRKPDQAGRVLRKLGRSAEAGKVFEEAGLHFEATVCYLEAGDAEQGLQTVTWVQRKDPRFRTAAGYAVRMATYRDQMTFKLESFLSAFVETGPQSSAELETFYLLAKLFEKHDLVENAKEALRNLVAAAPDYRDSAERLNALERQTRMRPEQEERIRQEEEAFLRDKAPRNAPGADAVLPGLPPMPDLDEPAKVCTRRGGKGARDSQAHTVTEEQADSMAGTKPFGDEEGASNSSAGTRVASPGNAPAGRSEDDFEVGGIIANRYKLVGKIGQGGMAVVYRATDLELEEEIALKVFFLHIPDPSVQAECMARFKLELKLNRMITHQNVLKLYDIGLHRGHRYISMELLVGHALNELLGGQPMDFNEGLGYMVQTCEGLHSAHKRGVVHRDMKPENLFVTEDGEVKVMDFGIAKNTLAKGMTVAGRIAGTPQYMAPEQIQDFSSVSASADIYSIGIILYELFTGRLPFWHEELRGIYQMQIMSLPMPPRELNPDIPEVLEKVILRLLCKNPRERHRSCQALARELEQIRMRCLGSGKDLWG